MTPIFPNKCRKAILACLLFCWVATGFAQRHSKIFHVHWNETPDSMTLFSPVFEECGAGDRFPFFNYFKEFAVAENTNNPVACVSALNDVYSVFVSKSEDLFLNSLKIDIPDTIYYKVTPKVIGDSTHFVLTLFPYFRTDGGYKRVEKFSLSYMFDTIAHAMGKSGKSATSSVLADGEWYKIAVNATGIYKITVSGFENLGIPARGRNIADLSVFGNGGGCLPERNSVPRADDLKELAISVTDENGNGVFDGDDCVMFFGEAANVWRYSLNDRMFTYDVNPYSTENFYFFTFTPGIGSGKRIQTADESNLTVTKDVNTFISRAVINNDLANTHKTGQIWVGEKFTSSTRTRTFELQLPNMVSGERISARYAMASITTARSSFDVDWNGGHNTYNYQRNVPYKTFTDSRISQGGNSCVFSVTYGSNESLAVGYLDFIEANAVSHLKYSGGEFDFRNFADNGSNSVSRYHLSNARNVKVWDVSDHGNVKMMRSDFSGDTLVFIAKSDSLREFAAFNGSSFLSPLRAERIDNQNLHAEKSIDLVIVSHKNFLQQAERIADLHRTYDNMSVLVTTPEKIYNEFSSGKQDAIAIRSFMKMLFDKASEDPNLTKPRYLLLFGGASFDHRNLLQKNENVVVGYETKESFTDEGGSVASDDIFGYLHDDESGGTSESLDIGIGRLPARTVAQADILTDKIRRYMTRNDFELPDIRGDWRNIAVFLADDADPGSSGDVDFVNSSEYTVDTLEKLYPNLNIEKIYADAYMQQSGSIGSFYPDVTNAVTKKMNYGCVFLNYVGHGSPDHIGSERYMERSNIPNYSNANSLPFFMASTCSWGKYDDPDDVSGAETFLLSANGGGIGVVAASRPISHNRGVDTKISIELFASHDGTRNAIGDAFRMAKNGFNTTHALTLFGDPALKLSLPEYNVAITKINDSEVVSGIADTATVLSRIKINGEIQDLAGNAVDDFDGKLYTTVFDKKSHHRTLANDNEETEIDFSQQKSVLFKSQDTVIGGKFEYSFIVPKDVSYKYDFGKLSHYAQSDNSNAAGNYKQILFGGFNEAADTMEFYPEVRLFMNDSLFISGGTTNSDPSIYAILSDKVGINAVGSGIGHDITAVLDNSVNEIITLNDFFETDISNSAKGYIRYPLYNLSEGTHTLTLKAWNIYNYSGSATIKFVVGPAEKNEIGRFFAYPNPAKDKVSIQLEHNSGSRLRSAEIFIFDASGRLVRKLTPSIAEGSSVVGNIDWDFDTEGGAKVGRGVYFMRAVVTFSDGEQLAKSAKVIKN